MFFINIFYVYILIIRVYILLTIKMSDNINKIKMNYQYLSHTLSITEYSALKVNQNFISLLMISTSEEKSGLNHQNLNKNLLYFFISYIMLITIFSHTISRDINSVFKGRIVFLFYAIILNNT